MDILFRQRNPKYLLVWGIGFLVFSSAGLLIWLRASERTLKERPYRIGWEMDPPEQLRGDHGEPTGFAVELVREAARRRGIQLTWIYREESSEAALRDGSVDLWPLMTITPERLRVLHISPPYLESILHLVVLDDSPVRDVSDLSDARIGISGAGIKRAHLMQEFPRAQIVARPQRELVQALCTKEIEAAFTESHVVIATLLKGGGCPGHSLRIIPMDSPHLQLGVGATLQSATAADAIRDEIGQMSKEGLVNPLMAKWGYLPGRSEESIQDLLDARRRERLLFVVAVMFGLLVILAAWEAFRARRERNKVRGSEVSLRESEQRFRNLLENVQLCALIMDIKGNITFCNDYFLAITGWERHELIGRRITELLVAEDRMRVARILDAFSEDKPRYWTADPGILTKSGKVHWFRSNILVLHDARGQASGFANLSVDVTEHRSLQAQYLQAQKMEGLGRLAGGVAHDFNNLLTVINGYSEIIFRKLRADDPLRSNADQVRKAGARAADLTQQLLIFSRKQVVQLKPLDLNFVVADSEKMWKRLLGENIQLVTTLSPRLGQVMADAGQVHQILMNLVVNARDAMPDGGKLVIETSNIDVDRGCSGDDEVETIAGPYVALAVSDSGVGMDDDTKKRIFEPFFTTKAVGEGTGLGLATVYGIVKQTGGWIRVHSEPGAGTIFRIYLPRIQSLPEAGEASDTSIQSPVCSETILLVEDREEVRQLATEALVECGYRVLSTPNGDDALALVRDPSNSIHLLIADVGLPGMNGLELAKRVTAIRPATRVLITSGYTSESNTSREILARSLPYLPKPYTPGVMAAKVRAVIDGPAASFL